jgi:hypothetical protein
MRVAMADPGTAGSCMMLLQVKGNPVEFVLMIPSFPSRYCWRSGWFPPLLDHFFPETPIERCCTVMIRVFAVF